MRKNKTQRLRERDEEQSLAETNVNKVKREGEHKRRNDEVKQTEQIESASAVDNERIHTPRNSNNERNR